MQCAVGHDAHCTPLLQLRINLGHISKTLSETAVREVVDTIAAAQPPF